MTLVLAASKSLQASCLQATTLPRRVKVGDFTTKSEAALKIVCAESIDLSRCDNTHGIQAGTEAYFAARQGTAPRKAVFYREPQGFWLNDNILLIGGSYFSEDVQRVCERLRELAAQFSVNHRTGREHRSPIG